MFIKNILFLVLFVWFVRSDNVLNLFSQAMGDKYRSNAQGEYLEHRVVFGGLSG
jgi:hypothetical protein